MFFFIQAMSGEGIQTQNIIPLNYLSHNLLAYIIYLNLLFIVTILKFNPSTSESLIKYEGATCMVHAFSATCTNIILLRFN